MCKIMWTFVGNLRCPEKQGIALRWDGVVKYANAWGGYACVSEPEQKRSRENQWSLSDLGGAPMGVGEVG